MSPALRPRSSEPHAARRDHRRPDRAAQTPPETVLCERNMISAAPNAEGPIYAPRQCQHPGEGLGVLENTLEPEFTLCHGTIRT